MLVWMFPGSLTELIVLRCHECRRHAHVWCPGLAECNCSVCHGDAIREAARSALDSGSVPVLAAALARLIALDAQRRIPPPVPVEVRRTACPWCGTEVVSRKMGRPRRHCSASHRQMAYMRRKRERERAYGWSAPLVPREDASPAAQGQR
jgi:hypothetical protein